MSSEITKLGDSFGASASYGGGSARGCRLRRRIYSYML
jgi:hypothetical protein